MKTTIFFFLLFGVAISKIYAQSAIVVAGGDATGSGGKVSYTVGQIAYTYGSGTNGSVSQGVQQPFEISTLGNDNFAMISLEMDVYPNPTNNYVTLKIQDLDLENLSYQVIDVTGKLIDSSKISNSESQISLENYNTSLYFLEIRKGNKTIKTFKIIKK